MESGNMTCSMLIVRHIRQAGRVAAIETGTRLSIPNLDYGVSNEDIRELFLRVCDIKRDSLLCDGSWKLKIIGANVSIALKPAIYGYYGNRTGAPRSRGRGAVGGLGGGRLPRRSQEQNRGLGNKFLATDLDNDLERKQTTNKVEAVAAVAQPPKPLKREAEEAIEKQVAAKKQKREGALHGSEEERILDEEGKSEPKEASDHDPKPPSDTGKAKVDLGEDGGNAERSGKEQPLTRKITQGEKTGADCEDFEGGEDDTGTDMASSAETQQAKPANTPFLTRTLLVGNLSINAEKAHLEDFFRRAGEIADIRFGPAWYGGTKGYAYVEFKTGEAAQNALKLRGQKLMGDAVKLCYPISWEDNVLMTENRSN
ncbi:hypothetical protein RJ639_029353 [Escallonia herrerae]|uniref:RRM domain-containing protein n=1 Tax=Escallonia herrerae TaxID=1293975 RepID=A0AA88X297_9ASTE|nr:hypothetical protein RJ639_029353 [Escallonia herrerae]